MIDAFSTNRTTGKSNQNNRSKNKLRLGNHSHNIRAEDQDHSSSAYLEANYNKTINNPLTSNDINIETNVSNSNILVQPVSFQLKAAICYL